MRKSLSGRSTSSRGPIRRDHNPAFFNSRNGKLVASFPVEHSDQIMLVTDKGQLAKPQEPDCMSPPCLQLHDDLAEV
jgi:hypothetical protein